MTPSHLLQSFLADRREKREAGEKKAAEEKSAHGEGSGEGMAKSEEVVAKPEEGVAKPEEVVAKPEEGVTVAKPEDGVAKPDEHGEPMEVEEGGEPKAKEAVRNTGDGEEVRSKPPPATAEEDVKKEEKGSDAEKEGGEKEKEGEEKEGVGEDETPQYLARLLSELITGVADPIGPYRPGKPKAEEGEEPNDSGKKAETTADAATGESKPAGDEGEGKEAEEEEGGKAAEEGGEARPRTFAERYAGPEGTTVTISAAPAPPFGIPGLPPMEGPSLSIKNPGDGAEPEVSGRQKQLLPI